MGSAADHRPQRFSKRIRRPWWWGLPLCLIFLCSFAVAERQPTTGTQRISSATTRVVLDQQFHYWVDENRRASLDTLLQSPPPWQDSLSTVFRTFYRQAPIWMRIDIAFDEGVFGDFLLEVESPVLDKIEFFQVATTGGGEAQRLQYALGGDHHPLPQHDFLIRFPTFPLQVAPGQTSQLYLRIESTSAMIAPIRLWKRQALQMRESKLNLYYGAFFGIMAVMALYNLVLWVFIREHAYLYYVCYVVSAIFFQSVMSGYGYRYLWTENHWLKDNAVVLSVALCFIFAIAFVVSFLRLRTTDRVLYRCALVGMAAYLVLIWLSPFMYESTLTRIGQPLGLGLCLLAVWAAARQWRNGSQVATFFVIGWTLLVLGTAVYTLMLAGLLPYNLITRHIQEIGMLAEVVLLSFALAARINEEKHARRLALETSLSLAHRVNAAYQEQLNGQAKMTRELEIRVDERTAELQKTMTELNAANHRLEQLSLTDALTGLHNRRYLDQHLGTWMEFAEKQGAPLTAFVIDIDHFKKINDTFGHLIGDQCIKAVAASLKSTVHRPDDLVVRYGGEEFVVALRNTDAAGALQVAERARNSIEKSHWEWEGRHIPVTVSIGVAEFQPATDHEPALLLARADEALYSAKQTGRNRVVIAANLHQQAG